MVDQVHDGRAEATRAAAAQVPRQRQAVAGLALCALLPALGTSIANVALPVLARDFGASFAQVQWVVLAYLLAVTTLVVGAGRLGDLAGHRRLLLAGIVVFQVAALLGALAPTWWLLVAARAVQGVGAALLMALSTALVGEVVPAARKGRAIGLLGSLSATGTALGPVLGGLLLERFGWQAIFLAQLPPGLLALWLVARYLPPAPASAATRPAAGFDAAGMLLLAATLAAYALAMTTGRGHAAMVPVLLLVLAGLGGWAFVWVERRAAAPLLRPGQLRESGLRAGLATGALVSTVVMASLVVGPFHLAHGLGLGMAQVGLVLAIGPAVAALAGVPAGRLVDHFGSMPMVRAGLVAMVVGAVSLCLAPPSWGVAGYAVPLAVLTAGYALFQAANTTAVLAGAVPSQRGVVSGLLNLSRNLGLLTGASAMGALFAAFAGPVEQMAGHPDAVVAGMRVAFGASAVLVGLALLVVTGRRQAGGASA